MFHSESEKSEPDDSHDDDKRARDRLTRTFAAHTNWTSTSEISEAFYGHFCTRAMKRATNLRDKWTFIFILALSMCARAANLQSNNELLHKTNSHDNTLCVCLLAGAVVYVSFLVYERERDTQYCRLM
jgi:hypothetical protein